MVQKESSERMSVSELIKILDKEKVEKVLKISNELTDVVLEYDRKIEVLEEVLHLKEEGKSLTGEQYTKAAKLFCPAYWRMNDNKIDYEQTICRNCGPGAIEECITYGKPEIADKLVL